MTNHGAVSATTSTDPESLHPGPEAPDFLVPQAGPVSALIDEIGRAHV